MSNDPIDRVRIALSKVLAYHRLKKNLTIEMVADASEFLESQIEDWENASYEPDVTDFFRFAWALGIDPTILFIDIVTELRKNPTDLGLYKSRVSDFERLYRVGYHHDIGDFREHQTTYYMLDQAMAAAKALNVTRKSKRLPLLDTVLIYVRLANVAIKSGSEGQP